MGHLTDNTPTTRNWVFCQDLYQFRIIVNPRFASDLELQAIVKDVIPDVEEWQFSGRRFCRKPRRRAAINPVVHPAKYAQNSRKIREYDERVVFAFHTSLQRDLVTARLTSRGFKFQIEDEPSRSPINDNTLVIFIP